MLIVADENIPSLEAFAAHAEVVRLPGRAINAAAVKDADALLVRSVTRVDADLVAASKLSFVGTCTIGTDHLDTAFLNKSGITWHNAPGCNARSVVEYVLSALHVLSQRTGANLADRTYGIVGVGQVGQRLAQLLTDLGWRVLLCDPPRQHGAESPQDLPQLTSAEFVSFETVLAHCDVISLHTPLLNSGQWPTQHLLNKTNLNLLAKDCWLLNAARGAVIDNQALLEFMQQRPDVALVLDVWEQEPALNPELAKLCQLATPHIAGYSLDGKIRGTEIIYARFCQHFSLAKQGAVRYPDPVLAGLEFAGGASLATVLPLLSLAVYDPRRDAAALRLLLDQETKQLAAGFDLLRKNYPLRREMLGIKVSLQQPDAAIEAAVLALGMQLA